VRQFSVLNGLRLYLSNLLRAILNPYAKATYAQGGEDAILRALLGNKPGFYVEVGANHPQYFSNVFELYKRGWHGVSIEANERWIAKHQQIRPRDQAVCALVSNEERDVTFTEFDEPLVSSLDLGRYRPRLIVVEMHGFAIERREDDPIRRHLRGHGYTLAGHMATRSYFQDSLQAGHVR
jgi:hypothetical protein